MMLTKSRLFLIITTAQILVLVGLIIHFQKIRGVRVAEELPLQRELVKQLELTDLAIWTEARYTRHPSQADFFSAFQDGPASLEHFPAGSVVGAPERLLPTPAAAD